ncbi:uncharacterized protein [Parasteatoda tepidariorum]|uniref:uncharacterized protein n=1 Tax=Parasteatoda tepidariorum TaxID=114398 RepID=UPI00077FC886|nr:uncharacterized protein LOC107449969 [Parasteatoda tepidariorum]
MQSASSKVECLSSLYLNTIKQPVKKLILFTVTEPSFQSIVKSLKFLKTVTRNIDDLANCLWSRLQEKTKTEKNEQYSSNQKKTLSGSITNNEINKRCNMPSHNKNKRYLAVFLLSFLGPSDNPMSSNQSKSSSFDSVTTSGAVSSKFKFGLSVIQQTSGSFSKLLKRDNSQPLIKTMIAQQSPKQNQSEEIVYAFKYRVQRTVKIVERRFGILAPRAKKPFTVHGTTIKTITKSAQTLNNGNLQIILTANKL